MRRTYADVIKMLEQDGNLFVAIHYPTGSYEWLPVDKKEYLRQLRMIADPTGYAYPCYFEVDRAGDMYIHPKHENV